MDREPEGSREPKGSRAAGDTTLERAIVLQLLRDDHERTWSRAQLTIELQADGEEVDRAGIDEAVRRLEREGVLGATEQEVWASDAARRLDELELIGV
jgi:Fe2+ or Zn2+ uptake regulation protein